MTKADYLDPFVKAAAGALQDVLGPSLESDIYKHVAAYLHALAARLQKSGEPIPMLAATFVSNVANRATGRYLAPYIAEAKKATPDGPEVAPGFADEPENPMSPA